jgi:malonyl-CoA decarboxylase
VSAPGNDLLDRRAALLAQGPSAALDELTDELRTLLDADDTSVRRITLDEPGDVLARLAADEPVHPVDGPEDLADRLDADRRCFVLEHPALPGRPLNVVWVALWRGVAGDVAEVLDREAPTDDPAQADTTVFYSIWSAEPGARGLPGGRLLLEGAIEALRAELPRIDTFVTLSPIPGFRQWWEAEHPDAQLPGDDALLAECVRYLSTQSEPGRPLDAVARFHLRNGARLLGLHRHGDTSSRGLERSFGLMANYRYEPEDRAANRAALRAGRVALSAELRRWRSSDLDRVSR